MSENGSVRREFRPSRISSEGPEVVQAPEPTYQSSSHENSPLSPRANSHKGALASSLSSLQEENHDETELEILDSGHHAGGSSRKPPNNSKWRIRRLIVTASAVVVAFLVGGGVGGGIGASVASTRASVPTVTVTAPHSKPTTIVDYAGCPSVNNMTYTPRGTNKQFLKLCGMEIMAFEGKNIDMASSVEPNFNRCLEACAEKQGCVGVTWFIFSASDPKKNSVCFFKDGLGNATSSIARGQQLASGILRS